MTRTGAGSWRGWPRRARVGDTGLDCSNASPPTEASHLTSRLAWNSDLRELKFIPGSGFSLEDTSRQTCPSKLFPEEPAVVLWLEAFGPDGHGEFANSRNNGPWGEALVHELIPEVERRFRCFGQREARLVRGHSAGGGTVLSMTTVTGCCIAGMNLSQNYLADSTSRLGHPMNLALPGLLRSYRRIWTP